MIESLKQLDRDIFIYLNSIGVEKYDGFWVFITQVINWIPLVILFFILIVHYYKRREAQTVIIFLLIVVALTVSITGLVKGWVGRLRPGEVEAMADLIRVLQKPSRSSFFSGHASYSFAITTYVVLSLKRYTKWIYLSFIWPILFVMSRIYVGVHYPSDLVVGTFVGILIAFIGYRQSQAFLQRPSAHKS